LYEFSESKYKYEAIFIFKDGKWGVFEMKKLIWTSAIAMLAAGQLAVAQESGTGAAEPVEQTRSLQKVVITAGNNRKLRWKPPFPSPLSRLTPSSMKGSVTRTRLLFVRRA
jgi:hypothetical protein